MLSILAGEISLAEAARREKVSEQSIGRWKAEFLEGGKAALIAGKTGPSSREEQLEAEVAELTQALGEAAVEIRVWKKSAEGRLGPSRPRGNPHRRGHADFEVLLDDRRARANLAALASQGPWPRATERAVAAADPGRGKGNGRQARRSTHRVGASQSLGDDQA